MEEEKPSWWPKWWGKGGDGKILSSFPAFPVPALPFTWPFPKAHPEAVSSGGILGCNERLNGAKPAKLRHWKCEFHTRPWEGWSRSCSRKFPFAGWLSSNCLPAWRHLKSSSPPVRASDWSVAHLLSAGVQVLGLAGLQNQVGGSRRGNSKGRDAGQQNQTKPPPPPPQQLSTFAKIVTIKIAAIYGLFL